MPPALSYTWLTDDKLYTAGTLERKARVEIQNRSDAYYDNEAPNALNFDPLEPDLNVKINLFQEKIDRRVSFLFPSLPDIELDNDETVVNEDETWLDSAWEQAGNAVILGQMALMGCKYGHIFAKVLPARKNQDYPRIILVKDVIVYWQADDVDVPLWYEYQMLSGSTLFRQDILDLDSLGMGTGWEIREYTAQVHASAPKAADFTLTKAQKWPFDCPPIIDWQHWPKQGEYYGGHEAGDLDLQDTYNRVATNLNQIVHYFAAPRVVGTGIDAGDGLIGGPINGLFTTSSKDARFQLLESGNRLGDVYAFLDRLEAAYRRQGRYTVLTEADNVAQVTNLGLQLKFKSMTDANTTLQHQYGNGIKGISLALLCVGGRTYDYKPTLDWPDTLPISDLEQANVVTIQDKLGLVSDETASQEMGLDPVQEAERMEKEKADKPTPPPAPPPGIMPPQLLAVTGQQGKDNNGQAS